MISNQAQKINIEELRKKVFAAGENWHHHCLSLKCFKNDTGKDVVLLETSDGNFYCESTKELKEELEERAYQQAKPAKELSKPVRHAALDWVKKYGQAGQKWHFHIALPKCLLNDKNTYLLIVENDETKEMKTWEFSEKPVALVRAIDDYYLGRKK